MTNHENLPFSGQPSTQDILNLLLNGGVDCAIISLCSQASSVSLAKDDNLIYEEKDLDYNGYYINSLRFGLQSFAELPNATVVNIEKINIGRVTHVTIAGDEGNQLNFAVTSTGINNKFNRLTIAREYQIKWDMEKAQLIT